MEAFLHIVTVVVGVPLVVGSYLFVRFLIDVVRRRAARTH